MALRVRVTLVVLWIFTPYKVLGQVIKTVLLCSKRYNNVTSLSQLLDEKHLGTNYLKTTMVINAKINPIFKCLECGWPVVNTLNNDGMGKIEPYCRDDYWIYCSNKTCKNHEGEGFNLNTGLPKFVFRTNSLVSCTLGVTN